MVSVYMQTAVNAVSPVKLLACSVQSLVQEGGGSHDDDYTGTHC